MNQKPTLLVRALHVLLKTALKIYFRSTQTVGKEFIPPKGPLLIVANHPASVLDPMLVGAQMDRNLGFITRGDLTRKPFWAWLYSKLNLIPVFRPHETPDLMHKNKDMFRNCFTHLRAGGSILLFPEGFSVTERRLRKIKTGAARIALGAEEENDFELGIKILPVGLTYSNPHSFRSKVFIKIGKPLSTTDYKEEYRRDERVTVEKLTADIKIKLEELSIVVPETQQVLVESVEKLFSKTLSAEYAQTPENEREFSVSKDVVNAASALAERENQALAKLTADMHSYIADLRSSKIRENQLYYFTTASGKPSRIFYWKLLRSVAVAIVGFPILVYGAINNFLPYKIPGFVARKVTNREAHYGSIYLIIGLASFPVFYGLQCLIIYWTTRSLVATTLYGISLPITGFLAFYYVRSQIWDTIQTFLLFIRNAGRIRDLVVRQVIINMAFQKLKKNYQAAQIQPVA